MLSSFNLALPPSTALRPTRRGLYACAGFMRNGDTMGVLIYVLLTIAVFAVLGLAQKLVERL